MPITSISQIIAAACKASCTIYSNINSQKKMFKVLSDISDKIGDRIDETILIKFRSANIALTNLVLSGECYREKSVLDKPEALFLELLGLNVQENTGSFSNQELLALTYYGLFLIESIRNNNEKLVKLYILRAFETEYPLVYKEIFADFFERVFRPQLDDLYRSYDKRLGRISDLPFMLDVHRMFGAATAASNSFSRLITGDFEGVIDQGVASYRIAKNKMQLDSVRSLNERNMDFFPVKIEERDYISKEDLLKLRENDICRTCAMLASQIIETVYNTSF